MMFAHGLPVFGSARGPGKVFTSHRSAHLVGVLPLNVSVFQVSTCPPTR